MFKLHKKIIDWNGKTLELETGKIARQADAAVVVKMGGTVVLCTVVGNKKQKEGIDFFPLTVNYQEKFYAIGKIPGGFNKRESKPSEHETLVSRLIDRPIRPLFPQGFYNEVQIVCTVLSYDTDYEADILSIIGASAALTISGIPFTEPVAAARVGYIDGKFVLNPTYEETKTISDLDLIVSGTESSVLMVESAAKELSEELMLEAVMFGHKQFQPIIQAIKEFAAEVGKPAWEVSLVDNSEIDTKVKKLAEKELKAAYAETQKQARNEKIYTTEDKVIAELVTNQGLDELKVKGAFKNLQKDLVRSNILDNNQRIDGRNSKEIRNIVGEVDFLPKTHGSALFTRGETQAICVTTLGTESSEQMVENLHGLRHDRFMLHYNFPPFSVGEVGRMGAPGRREIGHGKLAFRALSAMLPSKEEFPYAIRVVSEITESNGSSSMATVCGSSMSMMAAGVPLKSSVAGIAMGLIKEGEKFSVLSDIMGDEDYLGDMDFKVAGTAKGITALQMDIKINGINEEIMKIALSQASEGRFHILGKMADAISTSRTELNENAPRITSIKIEKDKIREVIGSGGKVIRDICEKSGAEINIADDGTVKIASNNDAGTQIALNMIKGITTNPEIGDIYDGVVIKLVDFGAIISFFGVREGLLHISELTNERGSNISNFLSLGQAVKVKVISLDHRTGKVKLTLKDKPNFSDDKKSSSQESEDSTGSEDKREPREPRGEDRRESREPRGDDKRESREPRGEDRRESREPRGDDKRESREPRGESKDRDANFSRRKSGNGHKADQERTSTTEIAKKKKRFF
ncbi:polyribonucleotide nucleotidyltransferase [Holosporaceae bacterium 'Namur']|nr:polyribonucleotide nucleotidyltransferase [Holosporaceae bacterium 'Namur']